MKEWVSSKFDMLRFWIIFLFIYTVDIRVRAEAESVKVFQDPRECLEDLNYCLVKNYAYDRFYFLSGGDEVSLGFDAHIVRHIPGEFTLVKGKALLYTKTGLKVNTPYGRIVFEPETTALLTRKDKVNEITVLFGKARVNALGETDPIEVLPGYSNSISGVKNLKAQIEIPKPAPIELTLKEWAMLSWKNKSELTADINEFKSVHSEASQQLSILAREIAMREVESHQQRELAQQKARQDRDLHQRRAREKTEKRLLLLED